MGDYVAFHPDTLAAVQDIAGATYEAAEAGEKIADAINNVADAIRRLGFNNASTEMGALEGHTIMMDRAVKYFADSISSPLSDLARSVEGLIEASKQEKR